MKTGKQIEMISQRQSSISHFDAPISVLAIQIRYKPKNVEFEVTF